MRERLRTPRGHARTNSYASARVPRPATEFLTRSGQASSGPTPYVGARGTAVAHAAIPLGGRPRAGPFGALRVSGYQSDGPSPNSPAAQLAQKTTTAGTSAPVGSSASASDGRSDRYARQPGGVFVGDGSAFGTRHWARLLAPVGRRALASSRRFARRRSRRLSALVAPRVSHRDELAVGLRNGAAQLMPRSADTAGSIAGRAAARLRACPGRFMIGFCGVSRREKEGQWENVCLVC
jgi:hypothetical protein